MSKNSNPIPYAKYHGLGNDYIIIPPEGLDEPLTPEQIRAICQRNYGVGSDGILLGPLPDTECDFALQIFNPDGSVAEKSGNGLRIFARYLWDRGLVQNAPFSVATLGGNVVCTVDPDGQQVTVSIGRVSFRSQDIPVGGPPRQVLNETLQAGDRTFTYCAASLGNPHCVILCEQPPSAELARRYGPLIENHPNFPRRTNVQFMSVIDRRQIQIEIWERGAGYTLASGSSSTAAAAVAHRLGWCDAHLTVHVPGGELQVELDADFNATLRGPVARICAGEIFPEVFTLPASAG